MSKMYYEKDGNLGLLDGKKVAIIGYGSQGHAHALNLHESGVDVTVGLYEGSKSWARAEEAGLKVTTAAQAAKDCDIIMIRQSSTKSQSSRASAQASILLLLTVSISISVRSFPRAM